MPQTSYLAAIISFIDSVPTISVEPQVRMDIRCLAAPEANGSIPRTSRIFVLAGQTLMDCMCTLEGVLKDVYIRGFEALFTASQFNRDNFAMLDAYLFDAALLCLFVSSECVSMLSEPTVAGRHNDKNDLMPLGVLSLHVFGRRRGSHP